MVCKCVYACVCVTVLVVSCLRSSDESHRTEFPNYEQMYVFDKFFYFFHPYIKLCAINREGPIDSVQIIYPFLLNDWCKPNSQWKLEPPNEGKQKSYTPKYIFKHLKRCISCIYALCHTSGGVKTTKKRN